MIPVAQLFSTFTHSQLLNADKGGQRGLRSAHTYIPVCYVADVYGADKKPSVHSRLEEVQLPGVLTHQVKLKEQPQLEAKE